jgi:hypothetical protein
MPFDDPMHGAPIPSLGTPWTEFLFIELVGNLPRVEPGVLHLKDQKEGLELLGMPYAGPLLVLETVGRVPSHLAPKDNGRRL